MDKVNVLMSTYNGSKYLKEQLDSIFNQKNVEVKLIVRDDGSSDETVAILNSYSSKIKVYQGNNLKPAKSFMELLYLSELDGDFFAFSDQDDIWKEDKLMTAVKKIRELEIKDNDIPILYCSDKELIDINGNIIPHKKEKYNISFESSIIKNIATGCTIVMNKKLMEELKKYRPNYIEMHDSWAYRVCLAIGGRIIYDEKETIKYRQHAHNVIGARESVIKQVSRRIRSFFNCQHVREKTATELLNGYATDISDYNREILLNLSNYRNSFKNKMAIFFNRDIRVRILKDDWIFRIALLINRV